MATPHEGWILKKVAKSVALATMGSERYFEHFTGDGEADEPLLVEAIARTKQLGWTAGVDLGGSAAPGTSAAFVYGLDVLLLSHDAENEAAALSFFEMVGSREVQAAFSNIKAPPVRVDIDAQAAPGSPIGPSRPARRQLRSKAVLHTGHWSSVSRIPPRRVF